LGYFVVLILFLSGNEGRRDVCVWGERGDGFYYVDMTGNFVYLEEGEKECEGKFSINFNYGHIY
jgi:hypothetical protein